MKRLVEQKLYTVQEAAEVLKMNPRTVQNKMSSRQLGFIKGRPPLIPQECLEQFLSKRFKRALV